MATKLNMRRIVALTAGLTLAALPALAAARPNSGGGGGGNNYATRSKAPGSVNHGGGGNHGGNNKRGNVNIDNSHNTNVNVSGNYRGGYNNGGYYNGYHDHDVWDAVGTAAAVTATVALTSAVIGSATTTRPPDCVQTNYGGATYLQCGSSWYQPSYVGSNVQYVVVGRPY